jgi:hypothetical protein
MRLSQRLWDYIVVFLVAVQCSLLVVYQSFGWTLKMETEFLRNAGIKPEGYTAQQLAISQSNVLSWSRGSSVSTRTGWVGFGFRQGQRTFLLASASRQALGPTQLRILSPGVKRGRGVRLTTHPQLVPRSRTNRSYTSSSPKCHHDV